MEPSGSFGLFNPLQQFFFLTARQKDDHQEDPQKEPNREGKDYAAHLVPLRRSAHPFGGPFFLSPRR